VQVKGMGRIHEDFVFCVHLPSETTGRQEVEHQSRNERRKKLKKRSRNSYAQLDCDFLQLVDSEDLQVFLVLRPQHGQVHKADVVCDQGFDISFGFLVILNLPTV
jgi:hypothetical protein